MIFELHLHQGPVLLLLFNLLWLSLGYLYHKAGYQLAPSTLSFPIQLQAGRGRVVNYERVTS